MVNGSEGCPRTPREDQDPSVCCAEGSRVRTSLAVRNDASRPVDFHDSEHDADCPVFFDSGADQFGEVLEGREVLRRRSR